MTSAQGYGLVVYWSDEDQLYVAAVPQLPGCAAHGATQVQAAANVEPLIGEWIDVARRHGRPVPEPRAG
jgi:predicted RNase H-like HicB family nuclease